MARLSSAVWRVTTTTMVMVGLAAAAPVASGNSFSIDGNAYSHEGVARLLTRLTLIPDLTDVTLGSSTRVSPGKRSAVQFTINAAVRAPGGAS